MITIIVAVAEGGVIGGNGTLLWHISEDLRRFKVLTTGHTVVMGRKTYESIGRPLPNRHNIIITRNHDFKAEGCTVVGSLDEAVKAADGDEIFIIGGGEIYRQSLPIADRICLTIVKAHYEGDTTFKYNPEEWLETSREEFSHGEKFEYPFAFVNLERKK